MKKNPLCVLCCHANYFLFFDFKADDLKGTGYVDEINSIDVLCRPYKSEAQLWCWK